MRKCVKILDVNIDDITMGIAVEKIVKFLEQDKNHIICTPNAEIMMKSYKDEKLKEILNNSDMVVADGAGVVLASKILGCPLKERIAGYDLVQNILKLKLEKKIRIYLLGGSPNVAKKAIEKNSNLEGIEFVGEHHGYFTKSQDDEIIEEINKLNVDILLVGLGAPKQEKWIYENKDKLNVKICIGVGGSFDVMAGNVKRAPKFFQEHGLEWFYRLCKQPQRIIRMIDLPLFILLVMWKRTKSFME